MLRALLSVIFIVFISVGCDGPKHIDYFPYHDDGTPKPRVALIPVIDSSSCKLPWDVSQELSESIYNDLMDSGEFYVLSPTELGSAGNPSLDFFGDHLELLRNFHGTDFVIALELVEHSMVPCGQQQLLGSASTGFMNHNTTLNLRMRVRIIDIRDVNEPRTILYEMIKTSYKISPPYNSINYEKSGWGTEEFSSTPYCIAHKRIVQNLTSRMEDIIRSVH